MNLRQARKQRKLLLIAVAAALAVPAPAVAGGDAGNRVAGNDAAHFSRSAAPDPSNPFLRNDRAHFSEGTGTQSQGPAPVVVRVDGGFDWASAGVGAAGMLGLTLVAIVGGSALRRRNHVGAATT
jgi:hypothetical protein